jgi:hypothetical protein
MICQSIILKKEAAVDKNCGVVLQGQKLFRKKESHPLVGIVLGRLRIFP